LFRRRGIHAFASPCWGCISGTYSTIAIATPMVRSRGHVGFDHGAVLKTLVGLARAVANPTVQWVLIALILAATAYASTAS